VRDQRRIAPAYPHIVETRAEILRAHLSEHGFMALARVRDADEHLDVPLLVDLHGGPLARTHAAARLQRPHDAQPSPASLRAPLRLLLAPTRVVERGQRAREFPGVIAAVVAHGHAIAIHEPRTVRHLTRGDEVLRP